MAAADIAQAVLAAWEAHDHEQTQHLLADDFTLTGPAPVPLDKAAYLIFQQVHNAAFADWRFNPQLLEADGDRVQFGVQITATHTGVYDVARLGLPIPAVPATSKRRQWPQETLTFTVRQGQIAGLHVETTVEGGVAGTLTWLGVTLPAPEALSAHAIGQRWAEIWNAACSLAVIDELVAEEFVSHSAPPGLPPGREGVRMWAIAFRGAFPDLWSQVEDVIVEGDRVVERFSGGGTHQGELFGIPPTGVRMQTTGINILRIAGGKVIEHWGNSDDLGVMRQLGVIA